jgi:hypothetical protein
MYGYLFFEDGKRQQAKECGQLLEAGKGKETNYLLQSPERNAALFIPYFLLRIHFGLLASSTVR